MKTRILLFAMLFIAVTAFKPAHQSGKDQYAQSQSSQQKLAWQDYCGYLSSACNGVMTIKIASDLSTAYVLEVTGGGTPLSYSVVSITPVPGSAGVFSVNINYSCNGTWTNYTGGAYTSVCP